MAVLSVDHRIRNALASARSMRRRSAFLGTDPTTGAMAYSVLSSHGPQPYLVKAYSIPFYGGFRYGLSGTQYWLTCTCEAGRMSLPCRHSARVALRLQREERQRARQMRLMPYALPVVCPRCEHENPPGATVCEVCSHNPQEAYQDVPRKRVLTFDDIFVA